MPVGTARPPRRWKLRNPRMGAGEPLTPGERHISPHADLVALIAAVIAAAVEDLDEGHGWASETAKQRHARASAYLFFFHGSPTAFDRFLARFGVDRRGMYPAHPLFDDPEEPGRRGGDLARLGLPIDLFDGYAAAKWKTGEGRR